MLSMKSMSRLNRMRGYLDKDFRCVDQFTVSLLCECVCVFVVGYVCLCVVCVFVVGYVCLCFVCMHVRTVIQVFSYRLITLTHVRKQWLK